MYGSIDLVVDKIERQIRKNKTKIEKKNRVKSGAGKLFTDAVVEEAATTTEKVVRSKTIDLDSRRVSKRSSVAKTEGLFTEKAVSQILREDLPFTPNPFKAS